MAVPSAPRTTAPLVHKDGRLTNEGQFMLEGLWRHVVAGFVIVPCTASGKNVITLTATLHREGARTYEDGMTFQFVAAETSDGAVTAKVQDAEGKALDTIKVFVTDGAAQAGAGDVTADRLYLAIYNSALDSGAGGLVLK